MRFKNNTNFLLGLGNGGSVEPYGITREYTQKDIENNSELQFRISNNHISEFTGKVPVAPVVKSPDIRFEVDPAVVNGKVITSTTSTKKPVQYVVADADGADGISMGEEGAVTSLDKDYRKSPEYIEEGVNARDFRTGADALEEELNKDHEESTFNDEDNLSENESEINEAEDADAAIAADATQFLKAQGKMGAEVTTAKAMIEKQVTSEMSKVNQEASQMLDNGEVATSASPKVTEFLKQPLNAKKFLIAKETDGSFLKEVDAISQSEAVKQLVKQRLEEIK